MNILIFFDLKKLEFFVSLVTMSILKFCLLKANELSIVANEGPPYLGFKVLKILKIFTFFSLFNAGNYKIFIKSLLLINSRKFCSFFIFFIFIK